jgi:phosphopantetheinyl transferase
MSLSPPGPPTWRATLLPPGQEERGALAFGGIEVPAAVHWAAEAGPSGVRAWLGTEDAEALEALEIPKRRQDRLAGRLAARAALTAFLPEEAARGARIAVRDEGLRLGQPYLPATASHPALELSISHAGERAIAAVGPGRLGVDLEQVLPRDEGFAGLAFSPAERQGLPALGAHWRLPPLFALTLQWCAKEAVLKWLGTGLRAPLQEVEVLFPDHPPGPLPLQIATPCWNFVENTYCCPVEIRCSRDFAVEVGVPLEQSLRLCGGWEPAYVYAAVW